jgi:hypothetical protein
MSKRKQIGKFQKQKISVVKINIIKQKLLKKENKVKANHLHLVSVNLDNHSLIHNYFLFNIKSATSLQDKINF